MIRTTHSLSRSPTLKVLTTNNRYFNKKFIKVGDAWVGEKNDYVWGVEVLKARDRERTPK